jgi:gamma-glutamyltranspeptidase / glutathione hydrolase
VTAGPFDAGAIATPHHLATRAGRDVLAAGGNAVDAVVAANLVLAVVTPYHCGVGGDLLAMVFDGRDHGVVSAGSAPAGATRDAVLEAIESGHGDPTTALPGTQGMPSFGALPVTVPGAVAGWFHLLERFGTRSFGALMAAAVELAEHGFVVSEHASGLLAGGRRALDDQPGFAETYGRMRAGARFVQPELAATLRELADHGPGHLHGGPLGDRVAEVLQRHGSTMTVDDLGAHEVEEVAPLRARYRGVEVLELPPPTQGVTALTALGLLELLGDRLPGDPADALHLQIEAVRLATADRQEHLADPAAMEATPAELLAPQRLAAMAADIDAGTATLGRVGRPAPGGTAYLCAADADGLLVSLSQSNFRGFGSGIVVPGAGFALHDRGAHFSLADADPNVIAPGKRPMHTLIPAMAMRDGDPWLVFGTMGGDAQPQIHVQLLGRLLDEDLDPAAALATPRFVVDVGDGRVGVEPGVDGGVVASLARRGHEIVELSSAAAAGHAHLLEVGADGVRGASDPRTEGGISGP